MAFDTNQPAQLTGLRGYTFDPLFTVGEAIPTISGGSYSPPGILDGIGAFALNDTTVRVLVVHELRPDRGSAYTVSNGSGSSFSLTGARISYLDVNKATFQITNAGLAYSEIYDANGALANSAGFLPNNYAGLSRFCSAQLVEAQQFGSGKGLVDRIFFANEETGGSGDPVGGGSWALDTTTGKLWQIPAFGRGGWENVTEVDTGTTTHVAFILADDTSPFDVDGDGATEAAPLFLYVGQKNTTGNFLERNGLSGGKLYVWVPSDPSRIRPETFNTNGSTLGGSWVEIDNSRNLAQASETGANGYDEYGYPTQRTLWQRAEAAGAFQFSRPEDVATNPRNGREVVLASTGVANLGAGTAGAGDTDGTVYTMTLDFTNLTAPTGTLKVLYSGDSDATEALRNPDNLDWADDGYIYVQEDRANGATLFSAVNPNEAGIVRINSATGEVVRIANINRSAVPSGQTDTQAADVGNWESSGIVDVSKLFGKAPGSLFLADVQAHGIVNQGNITNDNLVEGGQLLLLKAPGYTASPTAPTPANTLSITNKGTVTGTGSEIVAHDPGSQRLFVVSGTNKLEILNIANGTPTLSPLSIDVATVGGLTGGTANSVAVKNGIIAVAVQDGIKTNNGVVAFYDANSLALLKTVTVGALPDMLTFTPDGQKILVANEGESADLDNKPAGSPNPEGSISIIDLSNGVENATESKVTFNNLTVAGLAPNATLKAGNVRFSAEAKAGTITAAQDLEPEYIAVSPDGTRAFVTLQENNAFAIVDLTNNSLVSIKPLWSPNPIAQKLAVLDSSDRDGGIAFRDWSSLPIYSLYMPDSVSAFTGSDGQTYFITANEGDSRGEDKRIKDLTLDPTVFPDAAYLKQDDKLGRLNVSSTDGDIDGDGDYDELYVYGDRSFTIWDSNGNLVFDSGSQLEAIIAQATPILFNANNGSAGQVDTRSDDKGPEPEALTTGLIDGVPYAFVGLERAGGGVLVYNLSNPTNPVFDQYIRVEGDIAPEGLKFIPTTESPTGKAMLAVANEVSKTTSLFEINPVQLTPITDVAEFIRRTPDNLGSLTYNLSGRSGNVTVNIDNPPLQQTEALFHNIVGLYRVENANGAILDTFDANGNGSTTDLLNPGDAGYARTAISNRVNNFQLELGNLGNPSKNTSAEEFGDVLINGGVRYAPFVIANGGNLIPVNGTIDQGVQNFLAKNPNNVAATLNNVRNHEVAYFTFGAANPDGGNEHLQNRGNGIFGFEDLPGNLGVSDQDFDDAVFRLSFLG